MKWRIVRKVFCNPDRYTPAKARRAEALFWRRDARIWHRLGKEERVRHDLAQGVRARRGWAPLP